MTHDEGAKFFIIVLYNCKIEESESYTSIAESLGYENERAYLYIFDNSPQSQVVDQSAPVWLNVVYIHDPLNPGLGVAYNSGAKLATSLNLKWIILLDQDTNFAIDFIKKVNAVMGQVNGIKLFAPRLM